MGFLPRNASAEQILAYILPYLIALIVSIIYLLLPVDVIPDPILGLGQLDDIGVIVGSFLLANTINQAQSGRR